MSILQGSAKSVSADGGFYPLTINQSLRLNDNDSAYLSRTPSVAGNRKTWTFSCWFKRANLGVQTALFTYDQDSGSLSQAVMSITSSDDLIITSWSGSYQYIVRPLMLFRDTSAWYHLVIQLDTTQATASDRVKIYVNGERITAFNGTPTYPSLNADCQINQASRHRIGYGNDGVVRQWDGYLAEVHFTDGTAYDATAFGEFKSGVWVAKTPSVTYGNNGFYLPFNSDYAVEGFNAVTWTGNGGTQYIGGVGFEPDLVWIKERNGIEWHNLFDSVRGAGYSLYSNDTASEGTASKVQSFEPDGVLLTSDNNVNKASSSYVAWAWDAGTGSPVSNTDGTITSTVKANTTQGFSIVSYTGTGSAATVGHGLSSAPDMVIIKNRTGSAQNWLVWTSSFGTAGTSDYLMLNNTLAKGGGGAVDNWNSLPPTDSVINLGTFNAVNGSTVDFICYAFHSVAGYSSIGSYSGTGASGNAVTCGFRPAFVLIKSATSAYNWCIFDASRGNDGHMLRPNLNNAEVTSDDYIDFTDTGFTHNAFIDNNINQSGQTYIYMAFADTREAGFFLDQSGNNNDWTPNVLTESDVMLDSPTNNFATLNPLNQQTSALSQGNLEWRTTTTSSDYSNSTFKELPSSGKYYYEVQISRRDISSIGYWYLSFAPSTYIWFTYQGAYQIVGSTGTTNISIPNSGDILQVAVDCDSGKAFIGLNNTWYLGGDPVAGTGYVTQTTSTMTGAYLNGRNGGGGYNGAICNFGQDSSFAGTKTPQGYTDANGIGDFYYAPPTGYLALCTANLPEPAISPLNDVSPSDYFAPVTYTGNGGTQTVPVGFSSDLVWVKNRGTTNAHSLHDTVRGIGQYLVSNATQAEADESAYFTASDSDGLHFALGGSTYNASSNNYVAWNWLAGGTAVSNTDGTITSSVSANTTSGFSIVSYTGTGSAATVGHGLNSAPEMVIIKDRDSVVNWIVYNKDYTSNQYIQKLNSTDQQQDAGSIYAMTRGASTLSLGTGVGINKASSNFIAYCFHSVEGFSKIGSYVGNSSADGPYVHLGFKPAFIMIKNVNAVSNWLTFDNTRNGYNVDNAKLYPNVSNAEASGAYIDLLSNGFKLRVSGTAENLSGNTHIYIAFAENPFKYSTAR